MGYKRKATFIPNPRYRKRRYYKSKRNDYPWKWPSMTKNFQRGNGNKWAGTTMIPRTFSPYGMSSPLPDRMNVTMIYSDQISIATTSAGVLTNYYTFRLNSIYDPNFTATGHQPRGHDELNLFYKKYIVRAAAVEVQPLYQGVSPASAQCKWTLIVNNDVLPNNISGLYDLEEHVARVSPVYQNGQSQSANGNTTSPKYTYYLRLKDFYEVQDVMDDSSAEASFGTNPGRTCNIHLVQQAIAGQDSTNLYQVTIRYYVTVYKPAAMASS